MATEQVRVAGVLSVCVVAGLAGVLWGQQNNPPLPGEQQREADEREVEADAIETFAEGAEGQQTEFVNEVFEEDALEAEERAREDEAEVPAGG
ncbi:MAG: hypothetical protein ACF8R7_10070 [Phycisphaerales bacterium JB039]